MRVLIEGHLLHIAAGPCLTWDNGGPVMHQTWVETGSAPMGGVLGGLDPSPFNGIPRGLGLAVQNGKMTVDEAVGFIEDLLNNRVATVAGWRHALGGMIGQIRNGESGFGEMVKFLVLSALRRTYPYRGGLLARVTGTRDGIPAVVTRRTPVSGPGCYFMRNMAAITGFAPEDWAGTPRAEIVESVT